MKTLGVGQFRWTRDGFASEPRGAACLRPRRVETAICEDPLIPRCMPVQALVERHP